MQSPEIIVVHPNECLIAGAQHQLWDIDRSGP